MALYKKKLLEITELLPFGYEMLVIAISLKPEEILKYFTNVFSTIKGFFNLLIPKGRSPFSSYCP